MHSGPGKGRKLCIGCGFSLPSAKKQCDVAGGCGAQQLNGIPKTQAADVFLRSPVKRCKAPLYNSAASIDATCTQAGERDLLDLPGPKRAARAPGSVAAGRTSSDDEPSRKPALQRREPAAPAVPEVDFVDTHLDQVYEMGHDEQGPAEYVRHLLSRQPGSIFQLLQEDRNGGAQLFAVSGLDLTPQTSFSTPEVTGLRIVRAAAMQSLQDGAW